MRAQLTTGGERVAVSCDVGWVTDRLVEAVGDGFTAAVPDPVPPTMRVVVEESGAPFDTRGWERLARDAWCADGQVVVRDAVTSGFDLRLRGADPVPEVTFRWRPPRQTRAAGMVLRTRARLLVRAALLQYPVLWVASTRGRAPLHASALTAGDAGPAMLVGPSGVGKTTLVEEEVAAAGAAIGDNLAVGDGSTVWGLVEPMRTERGTGRAAPHGRRETHLRQRVPALEPQLLVVLRRGDRVGVRPCDPQTAARALVASTYAAGELRRYWPLHALLALGTGTGPPHPPVSEVAGALAARMRCLTVELPGVRGVRLGDVLAEKGETAWT